MYFKLLVTLLVATPCVIALTQEEAAQFSGVGCTSTETIGPQTSATVSGTTTTITTNHVPNHVWQTGRGTPNTPKAESATYSFSEPEVITDDSQVKCLPQGPIGIAKNGVHIYNPTSATGDDAALTETMDCNGGHADGSGRYHYHSLPKNGVVYDETNTASQFFGVAYDGLPIYTIGDGISTGDLDICHGKYVNGQYRYIASPDHFPYFLGCFRAQPKYGNNRNTDCSGMSTGSACTCQQWTRKLSPEKRLVELLRELLSSKTNPKFSWQSKRQTCTGTCGVSEYVSDDGETQTGQRRPAGRRQRTMSKKTTKKLAAVRALLDFLKAVEN